MDRTSEQEPKSPGYLQGCIFACRLPLHFWAFLIVSLDTCIVTYVRLAYDLNLCNMDEQQDDCLNQTEWSFLEEQRRAFWLVWEIDSFKPFITSLRRPYALYQPLHASRTAAC